MTTKTRIDKLISELRDPEYRHTYVEAHTKDTIAFQLRRMRLANEWEQKDVATKLGNPKLQPMISRYENPDYGRYSVTSLLELAKVFDVALVVRFAKFGELVRWDLHKTADSLRPVSYANDLELAAMSTETWMWRSEERTIRRSFRPLVGFTASGSLQIKGGSPIMGAKYTLEGSTRRAA